MAAQAALIEETIIGLKKALRRENDYSGSDEAITQPTNRGNKLRVNARYVHEGALGFSNPRDFYKQKIEHAGYTRYILNRNPPRYDSDGDEIDGDEEVDSEVEAEAADDNPFAGIALEQILCPLKQASELPDHPTLSQPYRSKALPTMIKAIDEKLRKERALLARAHNLHRQFLGDSIWIPCGTLETEDDPFIFRPRHAQASNQQHRDKRSQTGQGHAGNVNSGDNTQLDTASSNKDERSAGDDVEMAEAPVSETDKYAETKNLKTEDGSSSLRDVLRHNENGDADSTTRETNSSENGKFDQKEQAPHTTESPHAQNTEGGDIVMEDASESKSMRDKEDTSTPDPPRRMTTRAQANATNENEVITSSSSRYPSPDAATQLSTAHPLFLVPENIRPDKDFGLPPNEAEETRRLLWSYIQKQEETVRGFTAMLKSLRRADQLKEDVFEWCKAEGHIGEMSDGEDWYDREKLGLAEGEDLKKGADDDEVENTVHEERTTGKRGRRRQ
ncbi:conserved hypothetical protein [Talaromyces stipitatus ATCC 10500]|uniref:Transcriptional regulatory protein RXT2 N-terminal domain-containing protein n=1 Tax=Talaromyces stipitatus (strain ATCC 10500 / CBS 375.48 / QM 6759 / NRRL 1006) TaxID=441959 RepID=B8M739_TALSN|nr:uncharacterized protein TSTA_034900 [Talaromyces stipitatus ATCC 10500]EED20259.1 conserved hypothetical protein [Talaromyces stipitatus ATCC 10500]